MQQTAPTSHDSQDPAPAELTAMRLAIAASLEALNAGNQPYGATLVSPSGEVLLVTQNTQVTSGDGTSHAEMVLVREATVRLGAAALRGSTVFASGEPCAMCSGALYWAGVQRVVYGATNPQMADLFGGDSLPIRCVEVVAGALPTMQVDGPMLGDEALTILQDAAARRGRWPGLPRSPRPLSTEPDNRIKTGDQQMTEVTLALDLDTVNALYLDDFAATFGSTFEHSPWVAEGAWTARPFASIDALHGAMMSVVRNASRDTQIAFLSGHPELAGKEAEAGTMTTESVGEQASAGLNALSRAEIDELRLLNQLYLDRHGFPFIIAVRRYSKSEIFDQLRARIERDSDAELNEALAQIGTITRLRVQTKLTA